MSVVVCFTHIASFSVIYFIGKYYFNMRTYMTVLFIK